jgi:dynein heavy chain
MSNNGWKDMMRLVTLGEIFKGLTEDVESHGASWKEWYDLETPENATIPCGYSDKLNKF